MRGQIIAILATLSASPVMAQVAPPSPAPVPTTVQATPPAATPPAGVPPAPTQPATTAPGTPAQYTVPPPQAAPVAPAGSPQPAAYPYPGYAPAPAPAATAGAYYPPGGYAPATDPRPRYLPYTPDEPTPPGYRYEESIRRGPVVAGAITAGVPYLLGLLVASSENFTNKRGFLVVPGVGPWLTLLARESTCDRDLPISDCTEDFSTRLVLTIDGMLQTGGAILVAYGVFNPKRRYVLEGVAQLHFSPRLYPGGIGLGASGTF